MKELVTIQSKLKAPKGQLNKFGGYQYRSLEDIAEAVKPLLAETGCHLVISDDVVLVGDRIYVKATATLTNAKGEQVSNTAMAREPQVRKGMDDAQVTGATSSYARKYALNGLFCIDDTKDADATNDHGKASLGTDNFYSDAEFNKNKEAWLKAIETQGAKKLIDFIESKGKRFTDAQKQELGA